MDNLKKLQLSTRNPAYIVLPITEESGTVSIDLVAFDKWVVSQLPKKFKTKLMVKVDVSTLPEVNVSIVTVKSEQPIVEWNTDGVNIQLRDDDTGDIFDYLAITAPKKLPRYLRSRLMRAERGLGN